MEQRRKKQIVHDLLKYRGVLNISQAGFNLPKTPGTPGQHRFQAEMRPVPENPQFFQYAPETAYPIFPIESGNNMEWDVKKNYIYVYFKNTVQKWHSNVINPNMKSLKDSITSLFPNEQIQILQEHFGNFTEFTNDILFTTMNYAKDALSLKIVIPVIKYGEIYSALRPSALTLDTSKSLSTSKDLSTYPKEYKTLTFRAYVEQNFKNVIQKIKSVGNTIYMRIPIEFSIAVMMVIYGFVRGVKKLKKMYDKIFESINELKEQVGTLKNNLKMTKEQLQMKDQKIDQLTAELAYSVQILSHEQDKLNKALSDSTMNNLIEQQNQKIMASLNSISELKTSNESGMRKLQEDLNTLEKELLLYKKNNQEMKHKLKTLEETNLMFHLHAILNDCREAVDEYSVFCNKILQADPEEQKEMLREHFQNIEHHLYVNDMEDMQEDEDKPLDEDKPHFEEDDENKPPPLLPNNNEENDANKPPLSYDTNLFKTIISKETRSIP